MLAYCKIVTVSDRANSGKPRRRLQQIVLQNMFGFVCHHHMSENIHPIHPKIQSNLLGNLGYYNFVIPPKLDKPFHR
jgi:hypothetical protein